MVFIEKKKFIKPKRLKYTSHIKDFNIEINKEYSSFLKENQWDSFVKYMNNKRPDILLTLEYEPLGWKKRNNISEHFL